MIKRWILIIVTLSLTLFTACFDNTGISGRLKEGLRWITLDTRSNSFDLQVYRGDYVRFTLKNKSTARLEIPDLDIAVLLPMTDPDNPYIKFKNTGTFSFSLDNRTGSITVHEYERPYYTAVTSKTAQVLLKEEDLLILDVRTPGEYKSGHLKDAVLIPVQELQKRFTEKSNSC